MEDISEAQYVELEIRDDGQVVWFNVDGITVARVCRIKGKVVVTDHRPRSWRKGRSNAPS